MLKLLFFFHDIFSDRLLVFQEVHPGRPLESKNRMIIRAENIAYGVRRQLQVTFAKLLKYFFLDSNAQEALELGDFCDILNKLVVALGPFVSSKVYLDAVIQILQEYISNEKRRKLLGIFVSEVPALLTKQ